MTESEITAFARWVVNAATILNASLMPSFSDPTINRASDNGIRFDLLTRLLATAAAPTASREYNGYLTHAIRGLLYEQLNDIPVWEYVAGRFLMGFMTADLKLTTDGHKYMAALYDLKPPPPELIKECRKVH